MPSRSSAQQFYDYFKEDNQYIANRWLGGEGFKDSFEEYPESETTPPVVTDIECQLDEIIDQYHVMQSPGGESDIEAVEQRQVVGLP